MPNQANFAFDYAMFLKVEYGGAAAGVPLRLVAAVQLAIAHACQEAGQGQVGLIGRTVQGSGRVTTAMRARQEAGQGQVGLIGRPVQGSGRVTTAMRARQEAGQGQ
eukprot:358630-Chlamydomonas_euryale.AAC.3